MINKDFDVKLKKLREIYILPEDQKTIDEVEKKIRSRIAAANLAERPEVKLITEDAQRKIKEINILLAYDEELNSPTEEARVKRWGLFKERSIHQFYLDRFGIKNIEAELESIDQTLDSRIGGK